MAAAAAALYPVTAQQPAAKAESVRRQSAGATPAAEMMEAAPADSTVLDSNGEAVGTVNADGTITGTDGSTVTDTVIQQTGDGQYTATTQQTSTSTKTTDTETTVTTTTDTTTITAEVTGGTVTVTGEWKDTNSGEGDGTLDKVEALGPDAKLVEKLKDRTETELKKGTKYLTSSDEYGNLYYFEVASNNNEEIKDGITWTGNNIISAAILGYKDINSTTDNKYYSDPNCGGKIFELIDETGKKYYAYCADKDTTTKTTADYDIVNVSDYSILDSNTSAHISYVVTNGYWGTENTSSEGEAASVGSLEYVRNLASEYAAANNMEIDTSMIDDALAMSATQAAIWAYTNPNYKIYDYKGEEKTIYESASDNILFNYFKSINMLNNGVYGGNRFISSVEDGENKAATALFWALYNEEMDTANYVDTSTDFIQEEDIQSVTISSLEKMDMAEVTEETLTELVKSSLDDQSQAETVAENLMSFVEKGSELYQGDVTLTVAVVRDRVNSDDLKIYVYADDTLVAEQSVNNTVIYYQDGTTSYTVKDVVLPSGKTIRLRLSGTQNIKEGAYLYQCATGENESQTLTGLLAGGGTRNVDIDVSIAFNADGTNAVIKTDTTTSTTTSTETIRNGGEDEETPDPSNPTTEPTTGGGSGGSGGGSGSSSGTGIHAYVADTAVPTTDIPEGITPMADIPDEETPAADTPDESTDIPDDEVPMANVPETGDSAVPWIFAVLGSGLALAWTVKSKRY